MKIKSDKQTNKQIKILQKKLAVLKDMELEWFLEEIPMTKITLQKVINGNHRPSELLFRRMVTVLYNWEKEYKVWKFIQEGFFEQGSGVN